MERRKELAIFRKKLSNSGLCIICGTKFHNEMNYNHENDDVWNVVLFIRKVYACLEEDMMI